MIKHSLAVSLLFVPLLLAAQNRIGTGVVAELYNQHCLSCHGVDLRGGLGASLVDDTWVHGGTDADIARVIREGLPEQGMLPYKDVMSEQEIRAMVIYIREQAQLARAETLAERIRPENGVYRSQHHNFRLEKVLESTDDIFWSVSFLPDGAMLLTRFGGGLVIVRDGEATDIEGLPETHRHGQGGLLEAQAHPDYASNGWIYLGFTERSEHPATGETGYMTAVVRGRVKDGRWVDQEEIFHVPPKFHSRAGVHFGTRFVFKDGYLYFSIGDRGSQDQAQDLSRPNGKIHRIHDDGRIPEDNPFAGKEEAYPSIWTYGNRNPQGLDLHPVTGELWATEHGPRGGDELNLIRRGLNYGWPVITYGINYNGQPITDKTAAPGMEQPVHYWVPSIAVCGIDFYEGAAFPHWQNDLLVGGLASQHLERFRLKDGKVIEHEILFKDAGRVRDVSTGPDGGIYVILNQSRSGGPGGVYQLVPERK